jgi:hypothetical protein
MEKLGFGNIQSKNIAGAAVNLHRCHDGLLSVRMLY